MARYRSVVPLNSAPDALRPPQRVRYYDLEDNVRRIVERCGIMDGATMQEAKRCIEAHMTRLNDDQRRKLLLQLAGLLK